MKKLTLLGTAFLLLTTTSIICTSCQSTFITSSWSSQETFPHDQIKKIIVVGIINDNDRRIREHMESHMVGDLIHLGYNAISSLQEFGPKAFEKRTEAAILQQLKDAGTDAVVTISLLDKTKEQAYVSGANRLVPYATRYNNFWDYYSTYSDRIFNPGYYSIGNKYLFESNMYILSKGEKGLVFSAQSEAFDPNTIDRMAHSYGKTIIKEMKKKAVVVRKK